MRRSVLRLRISTRAALLVTAAGSLLAFSACGGGGNATTHVNPQGGAGSSGPTGVGTGNAGQQGTGGSGTGTGGEVNPTGAGGAGGSSTGAGGTVGQGAGMIVCTKYCNAVMGACTGANVQYASMADCMAVCSHLPAGGPTDVDGNTVGCRTNAAATAVADTKAIKDSCWAAGPLGYGTCGNECDILCPLALEACPTSYASLDDCHNVCSLFTHPVDQIGVPGKGAYSGNFMPGATPETKDTLDCRAYHLFDLALAGTSAAAECPNISAKSTACGPGPDLSAGNDGGTTSDGPIATYDGGIVNIINSTNWDETKYPREKRKMLLRDEGDPHLVMIDLSKTPIMQWKTVAGGPWARAAQLIGNNQILGGRNDGYEVFDYTSGAIVKTVNKFGNTQSAYRLATGETMLTRSGTILTFLDKSDNMSHQISYPGFGYVRVARPTRNGTFLVPSDTQLFEGDATGKVLWKTSGSGWSHIWEPLLLGPPVGGGKWNEGDTLLCTAFGSSCDVVDKTSHKVTFSFGGKNMPMAAMVRPNFFSEYEILPNGNIFCSNWQGHGGGNGMNGLQVLEFDPQGNLVWYWKQDPTIFSSIQGVQVMDGKDPKYLHVEETSANSTWQPVMNQ
jgi:hypothetical protein